MFKLMISSLIFMLSTMMITMKTPLSMGLMILLQTTMICLLTGMMIHTYWFSYILFLTFLGGLLVLFIYVSSISSNEMFKFSMITMFLMVIMLIILMIFSYIFNKNLFWMNFSFNYEMKSLENKYLFFNNENNINLNKLYNKMNNMMFLMIIYLLISLIAIVKITNIFYGPLRPMN